MIRRSSTRYRSSTEADAAAEPLSRLDRAGQLSTSGDARRSWPQADECLPADPLRWIESSDCVVEGRDVADVRPQSAVTHALDDLTQLSTIGLDNKVHRHAVGWP